MEIKKDPDYVRPLKIFKKPPIRTKDKYCAFYEANGYSTEGCISLRLLIEKFIENWKLIQLLVEQRNRRDKPGIVSPRITGPRMTDIETENLIMREVGKQSSRRRSEAREKQKQEPEEYGTCRPECYS
jgi:hypothetical protein